MKLRFYTVKEEYTNYLRIYDSKVPYTFEDKSKRPFIGIIFKVNNINYFAPLSSPKPKHKTMKNQTDFIKINSGEYGAININNMIPIQINECKLINIIINNQETEEEIMYKRLLINQIDWCNKNIEKILKSANKIYYTITLNKANKRLIDRCCNFKLLEEKCLEYPAYLESIKEVATTIDENLNNNNEDEEELEI